MDLLLISATLIVVACCLLYAYVRKRLSYFEDRGVPHEPPTFLLGNFSNTIVRRKHLTEIIRDLYNHEPAAKYLGVYNFLEPVIMLRDLDLVKSIGIKHFEDFPDHQAIVDESAEPLAGGNLAAMSGEKWREARNLLSPAFTSSKMRAMLELMIECAENLTNHVGQLVALDRAREVATRDLFTKYTNDVIATCAFGVEVDSLKNPENEFYVLGMEAIEIGWLDRVKFMIAWLLPRLAKFFNIKFISERITRFFTNLVETTVEARDERNIRRPDMLQLMMDARGKTSANLKLDVTQMTAQAFIFFFAGFNTTSSHMCIMAHELALNPDIQEKLQAEIDRVTGDANDNKLTYEAINSMPYLDAVFTETLRRHAEAPVLDRVCRRAFELPAALPGGRAFTVQPGMSVWIPVTGIHRDPKYFDNPEKFDPERYCERRANKNACLGQATLGFGIGPRSCIGNRFAVLETKILFFHLLSKFTLKACSKTCRTFEYDSASFNIKPKQGYWLSIEARN